MNTFIMSLIIAFAQNNAGGRMALTNEQGQCKPGTYTVFSFAGNGQFMTGCWVYADGLVIVTWQDQEARIYPVENFTPVEKEQ